jgi:two-component system phosphate regulon sensor histidine kinase PhoR
MDKIWQAEKKYLSLALSIWLISGGIFSHWLWSALVILAGYSFWLYYRMMRLEKWLRRGTKLSEVHDDNGFVGVIIRHLYHQKKQHSQRKKRTKDILSRLNRSISALPDATVLLNNQLEIEWCNEPAHYALGIHGRRDLGQRIGNLIRHPEFNSYLLKPTERDSLEIESPIDPNVILQVRIVQFGDNQLLMIIRNISDQRQLQDGLKNFVANASHELKSPLTVVSGHLELLQDNRQLPEAAIQSLSVMQKQTNRMGELIEDLLLLSQVESYHLQPDEGERFTINDLVKGIKSAVAESIQRKRLKFDIQIDGQLLGVRNEIQGICNNMIENALKYSDQGSDINVSWIESSQGKYCFSVRDTGPGISSEDLPHITNRYYRGTHRSSDQVSGSGLGLSIVTQAAAKHDAELIIKSVPGLGSEFTVMFPSFRSLGHKLAPSNVIPFNDFSEP